jgi:hypothetical protein
MTPLSITNLTLTYSTGMICGGYMKKPKVRGKSRRPIFLCIGRSKSRKENLTGKEELISNYNVATSSWISKRLPLKRALRRIILRADVEVQPVVHDSSGEKEQWVSSKPIK